MAIQSEQWQVFEKSFYLQTEDVINPALEFTDESVIANVRHESGTLEQIHLFYAGFKKEHGHEWVLRFCPERVGNYELTLSSTQKNLSGRRQSIEVAESHSTQNKGPVVIDHTAKNRFAYSNGEPCYMMPFECNWLFALDRDDSDLPRVKSVIAHMKKHGFNQAIFNVYAYDIDWFDTRYIEEKHLFYRTKDFPFGGDNQNPNHSRLNITYFEHLDRVFHLLNDEGIQAQLMIYVWNKQVNWPKPGGAEELRFFDYVVKRFQAFPNLIWNIAKEALDYGVVDANWVQARIERIKHFSSAHRRLITVHDQEYSTERPETLDFLAMQNWAPNIFNKVYEVTQANPEKPVLMIETGGYETTQHEVFWGPYLTPEACMDRYYQSVFAGAYCNYYWQNLAWYEIQSDFDSMPEEKKPRLAPYQHLADILKELNFTTLKPYQHYFLPYCLSDRESVYLFYTPADANKLCGFLPDGRHKILSMQWIEPHSGKRHDTVEKTFEHKCFLSFFKPEGFVDKPLLALVKVI